MFCVESAANELIHHNSYNMIVKLYLSPFGVKSLNGNLVIHSYKTSMYCPFARLNNNITLINKNQIVRFVVDQSIGSTFYAEH